MPEKIFSCARFNLDALLSLAGGLRGRECACNVAAAPKTGSMNWAIFVSFDDGLEWVFRSPRSGPHAIVSDESAQKMLLSEVATLKFLRNNTSVPVPEVYSFSGSYDNHVGVPYILMSKAAGRPLSDYDWANILRQTPGYPQLRPLLPLPDETREIVMKQLGALMRQLSTLRFEKIGSLFEDDSGNYVVGECLSPTLTWQERDSLDGIERGPFRHESQYLESLISAFISHAKELPLSPHAFFAPIPDHSEYSSWSSYRAAVRRWNDYVAIGAKIDSSKNRLSYCLAGQVLRQMIPHLSTSNDFYTLSHPDLHLGNIFVDEKFNIACLIDWGSASSGPISELLATPGLGSSAFAPPKQLVSAFRCGFCPEHPLPAGSWERADMIWYFSRLVRLLSTQDYRLFQALYKLVNEIEVEDAEISGLFNELAVEEKNQRLFAMLRADDYTASELEQEENAAFGCGKTDKGDNRAVARKLTVMAEINHNFLATSKLWRWVEHALRERDDD
ncbi:Protein kinase-like domain protein [Beauveria brongniartii RCEF 3172]|uniref:Protein kinase-like domain protein n=1 Tax=Beauveria brongniartii RCEF 3172 TaxID=1081107 RepID=A0A166X9T9_9HYPO|nr:Protein kinase-like domain protein [Beauveria brongniartii RCEF 3172]